MIRNATLVDYQAIENIHDKSIIDLEHLSDPQYQYRIQRTGFLLGTDEGITTTQLINNNEEFLVYEADDKVVGYLSCSHEEKFIDDEYKTWFNSELRKIYYNDPHATCMYTISVDSKIHNMGVATELLNELINRLRSKGFTHLFSIVTISPVTNIPSLLWHTKNGFIRIAMGKPRTLFKIDHYAAVLLCRQL